MITLYTCGTPNRRKISPALEELRLYDLPGSAAQRAIEVPK